MLKLLLLLLATLTLSASPAHPPLVPNGESYDDIAHFKIGAGHSSTVQSVAFSSDGRFIVSGSDDKSVKLWSVEQKKLLHTFEGHSSGVLSVAFSPDGKFIVSGSWDKSIKLWSVEQQKLLHTFEGHSSTVYSVAFSIDGRFIVSGSEDKSIKLWSVKQKKLLHTFGGHSDEVRSVAFSHDGRFIVSGSDDNSIKLWSVEQQRHLHTFEERSNDVNSVAFSSDGMFIVSGSDDKSIKLWSVEQKKLLHTFEGHSNDVNSVAFSPDGMFIVSGSDDKSIKLWSVEQKKLLHTFEGHSNDVNSVAFSPDGMFIVSGSDDYIIKLWSVEQQRHLHTFEGHSGTVNSVAFSSDGRFIVSGSRDNSIKLWSVEQQKLLHTFEGHSEYVNSVAFSPDGRFIVSGSEDRSVKLWSVEQKKLLHTFEGHTYDVYSVTFSHDGRFIVSGSEDESIKLWSVEQQKLLHTFEGHSGTVNSVAFSSDGRFIVSGSWDNSIELWSVEQQKLLYTFEGHSSYVNSVAFSSDGRFIVSGSGDNSTKLWSVKNKKQTGELYSIGKGWVWFDTRNDTNKTMFRGDDGSFIVDKNSSQPIKAKDNTPKDNLDITIAKEIDISSQKISTLAKEIDISSQKISTLAKEIDISSQKISTLQATITNIDKNSSYWISATSEDNDTIVHFNQIIKLLPNETRVLDINLSASLPIENRKPFSKTVKLKFVTANGEYTTKEIIVHFKTPKIEVKEAKYDTKNKALLVEIVNSGEEAIKDLEIRIGNEAQEIKELNSSKSVTKSFIMPSAPKAVDITVEKFYNIWKLRSPVSLQNMLYYYIALALLIAVLLMAIYYYRRYRNPLLVQLAQNDNRLASMPLHALESIAQKLRIINRWEDTLIANGISQERFDKIVAFGKSGSDTQALFVEITGLERSQGAIQLPDTFGLNITHIDLCSDDIQESISNKTLIITNDEPIQNALAKKALDKSNLLVAPSFAQLKTMLFCQDIYAELIKLFYDNLSLKDISPYQLASNVKKDSMFFGRVEILSTIINRGFSNYIIVGARQLGKSSLLTALQRRFVEHERVAHYITLDEDSDLVFHLSKALGCSRDMQSIQEAIHNSPKPMIFLIDEVDKLLKITKDPEVFFSIFRSLSQENRAYFVLAGYWRLYSEVLQEQSPLRNFGDIIELQGLEIEACREMITQPMKLMGISYESDTIVEKIIEVTGQRSNLVSVICSRLILGLKGKVIHTSQQF